MSQIHDFGEKIGGARKDVWKSRGLYLSDLTDMNESERKTHIKKDNVWPRPDWEQLIKEGHSNVVCYWQNKMRASIPPRPAEDSEISQENYIKVVTRLRELIMNVKVPSEIDAFYKGTFSEEFVIKQPRSYYVDIAPEAKGIINNKVLKAAQASSWKMQREAEEKLFGIPKDEQVYASKMKDLTIHLFDGEKVKIEADRYSENRNILEVGSSQGRGFYYFNENSEFYNPKSWEVGTYFIIDEKHRKPLKINFPTKEAAENYRESVAQASQNLANKQDKSGGKAGRKRKGAFVPPQLKNIHRTGPKYRRFSADSELFLKDLKFRGGEFGHWLNNDDRQASLNMAYDGLRDLARVLQIKPEDISLNSTLAIAFGARGKGGVNAASAHYEQDRKVINLTKMSGAGCLAHEWAHALDHAIGAACGVEGLASESGKGSLPPVFDDLLYSMKYKKVLVSSEVLAKEAQPKIERSTQQLKAWIDSVKPRDISGNFKDAWEEMTQRIIDNVDSFTGSEYIKYGRNDDVQTKPEIEILSQIRKHLTRHGIPLDTKRNISLWARDLKYHQEIAAKQQPQKRREKTDFSKGSIAFDEAFSRAGHGYWHSDAEMFARAFDCYISDKIDAAGLKSQYLTAYANSFTMTDKDGNKVSAIPLGEERALINEKFDQLFEDLKARGILHEHTEVIEAGRDEIEAAQLKESDAAPIEDITAISSTPNHYEQLSLDEMLFAAEAKRKEAVSIHSEKDYSR